jgi:hypothetical protein
LNFVASAILADVEPGFQPGGKPPLTGKRVGTSVSRSPFGWFFPGGWKPPSTAGQEAHRYFRHGEKPKLNFTAEYSG